MTTLTQEKREHIEQLKTLRDKPATGLMERAICIKLYRKRPGQVRKVPSTALVLTNDPSPEQPSLIGIEAHEEKTHPVRLISEEVQTDLGMLRISKQIYDAEEFEEIKRLDTRCRRYLLTKALPSIFQAGFFLVPVDSVGEVDHTLETYARARQDLVDKLAESYPRIVAEAKEKLGDLFNEMDYPAVEDLKAAFVMRWRYVSYGVADKLKEISAAMHQREKEKQEKEFAEASAEIKNALRLALAQMVNHMVDRLSPGEDGKRKTFGKAMLPSLNEFLDSFATRNICNDDEMAALVAKAKDIVKDVDRDSLRNDEGLRDVVLRGFQEVQAAITEMVVDRPTRKFRFESDES